MFYSIRPLLSLATVTALILSRELSVLAAPAPAPATETRSHYHHGGSGHAEVSKRSEDYYGGPLFDPLRHGGPGPVNILPYGTEPRPHYGEKPFKRDENSFEPVKNIYNDKDGSPKDRPPHHLQPLPPYAIDIGERDETHHGTHSGSSSFPQPPYSSPPIIVPRPPYYHPTPPSCGIPIDSTNKLKRKPGDADSVWRGRPICG